MAYRGVLRHDFAGWELAGQQPQHNDNAYYDLLASTGADTMELYVEAGWRDFYRNAIRTAIDHCHSRGIKVILANGWLGRRATEYDLVYPQPIYDETIELVSAFPDVEAYNPTVD